MIAKHLKGYLEQVYKLEKFLYELNTIYSNIENKIKLLEREIPQEPITVEADIECTKQRYTQVILIVCFVIYGGVIFAELIGSTGIFSLILLVSFMFGGGVLGYKLLWTPKNEMRQRKRNINKQNIKIVEDYKRKETQRAYKIQSLRKELSIIKTYLNNTYKILDNYYQCNIIFPKYRNFIAISSIYEYFSSGRCSQLEGREGAYNIFENEIRQNIIINNLNYIINNRVNTSKNQYMLHSALKESENKVNMIYHKLCQLSETNLNILEDKTILSYHTEVEKRNNRISNNLESYK